MAATLIIWESLRCSSALLGKTRIVASIARSVAARQRISCQHAQAVTD
jgi:hypothetical protein